MAKTYCYSERSARAARGGAGPEERKRRREESHSPRPGCHPERRRGILFASPVVSHEIRRPDPSLTLGMTTELTLGMTTELTLGMTTELTLGMTTGPLPG